MATRRPRHGSIADAWQVEPFKRGYEMLDLVHRIAVPARPLGCITGPAGTGKTFTAEQYQMNNPLTVIVTVPPKDILTPRSLLSRYADALGMSSSGVETVMRLYRNVVGELLKREYFVIVDEADRLRPSNADLVRELAEETSRPHCYLGCPSLLAVLDKVEPTHHRIGILYTLDPITIADLHAALHGKPLVPTKSQQLTLPNTVRKFDEPAIETIWDETQGNMRAIADLLHKLAAQRPAPGREGADVLAPAVIRAISHRYIMPARRAA